ncbi:hypothetical protein/SEL1 protein [Pseudobutyrivibrio sp. 49]|uniref:tetratricopeptide repeat protein n=1 Tax=Pseudobutyrivibrio sp. 49 TaxID=1855344 RepID=UPI000885F1BC|nr:SEL1-like repeat protein [Pseudobutyrivibrio sp. 49]SDH28589.1 hypothetical protein/SEL1 protein [Pseudobutyrivibrio sp. 49]
MRRLSRLFLISGFCFLAFTACGKDDAEQTEEAVDTTEQVAFDDVEVEDYTVLSYSELEVLAYQGDTEAQVMLGRMLEYGTEDVKQNFAEAISWYQMASDSGSVEGTDALGYFYLTGAGVEQNLDKAEELFKSAIDAGSVNAKVGLARVLLKKGDYEAAETELEEDTTEHATANEKKSTKKDSENDTDENELSQIVDLLIVAQQAGDLDGGYYLGYIYEKGIGVTQDYKKAYDYYNRVVRSTSTALNDRDSINLSNIAIALMYIKGYGVGVDTDAAMEHLTVASDNSSPKASYYIGQMYEKGIGVDKDYEKAMEYYLKAADFDFAPALNQIGYLYYNGYGVDVDFASAVYYQKLAALQGYAIAQVNLGFLYENGYGVERNLETALSYYEMAANSGYEGATEAVVRVKAQINEEM